MAVWPPNWTTTASGLLGVEDAVHVLRGERVEVQPVGGIEVGGHGFGVVVGDDRLIPQLLQGPDTVDRAVVELDALADADGAGAEHDHLSFCPCPASSSMNGRLVLLVPGGVEIGGFGVELRGAGVHHLVGRHGGCSGGCCPERRSMVLSRIAQLLGLADRSPRSALRLASSCSMATSRLQFGQEPTVDPGDVEDLIRRSCSALEGLVDTAKSRSSSQSVRCISRISSSASFFAAWAGSGCRCPARWTAPPSSWHSRSSEPMDITSPVAFIWVPSWRSAQTNLSKGHLGNFTTHVVQRRLEAGVGVAGHGVDGSRPGVQPMAILVGHLGDGIAGRLGGQCRGTGYPGIDLDHGVFQGLSGCRANWQLQPPSTSSAVTMLSAADRSIWYSLSDRVTAGATTMESPVCTPTGSTFSMRADGDARCPCCPG